MALEEYNRFSDQDRIARDANLEITEAFFPPYFESLQLLDIGDNDPAKVGAIATYKSGATTNLAIYQGGGVWREGTGYTDAEIDAMITAAKNRANHTGTQAINTIEGLEAALDGKISTIEKGVSNGVATLDGGGKVPANQLPNSVMTVEGPWNAATNIPTLSNGTGNAGMVYEVTTAGTVNLGDGNITFKVGDWAVYGADGKWYKSINSNEVTSVNGKTGSVIIAPGDLDVSNGLFIVGNSSGKGGTRKILPSDMGLTSGSVLYALSPSVWSELFASDNATPSTVAIRSAASSSSPGEIKAGPAINPEGLVRLDQMNTALAAKANSDGSNASGTWPIAISGNAPIWGGQQYSSDEVPINNYILAYGADGKWHPSNKERVNAFLGAPSTGETLQSVTNRGAATDKALKSSGLGVSNILSYTGTSGVIGTESNHDLELWANATAQVKILKNGNVGVGTTAPSTKLDVNGVVTAAGGNSTQWNAKANSDGSNTSGTWPIRSSGLGSYGYIDNDVTSDFDFAFVRNGSQNIKLISADNLKTKLNVVSLTGSESISGPKTFTDYVKSNLGFTAYASVNSQATYRPTGITFNPAANTYATIDANTSGGLTIRTADGSATAQIRMTFLTPNGATARSVMFSGRAYYGSDYSGSFEANDLIPKKYVDDKIQLITLRATISGGVAVLDGGAVQSGYRYMVQGASLYNGTTPEFLSLSKLAIQAGTTGNVVAQYETTFVDNGKDVEVLILKIKI
ncbi:hypothetical protein ACR79T_12480 [Sphingobacterium spiritivorum]|uniref:hypothetical protein n=1 Tax=Sphingobacterium spiritivorum TaxID=258 RepID=UPI003DA48140